MIHVERVSSGISSSKETWKRREWKYEKLIRCKEREFFFFQFWIFIQFGLKNEECGDVGHTRLARHRLSYVKNFWLINFWWSNEQVKWFLRFRVLISSILNSRVVSISFDLWNFHQFLEISFHRLSHATFTNLAMLNKMLQVLSKFEI